MLTPISNAMIQPVQTQQPTPAPAANVAAVAAATTARQDTLTLSNAGMQAAAASHDGDRDGH